MLGSAKVIITYEVYKGFWLKGPRAKQLYSGQMVILAILSQEVKLHIDILYRGDGL